LFSALLFFPFIVTYQIPRMRRAKCVFPAAKISTVFFLAALIFEQRRARNIITHASIAHAKYIFGVYGGRKKVVYITRLVCVCMRAALSILLSRIINIIISNIRAPPNDISYELNPRGIEDEIAFCAQQHD
jgi:hypothetical protein